MNLKIKQNERQPAVSSGQEKAGFRPDHQWDLGTCISLHGIGQLENQWTTSQG